MRLLKKILYGSTLVLLTLMMVAIPMKITEAKPNAKSNAEPVVKLDKSQYKTLMDLEDYLDSGDTPVQNDELDEFIKNKKGTDSARPDTGGQKEEKEEQQETVKEEPEINRDDWRLILVNKQNQVPDDYNMNLVGISGSIQVDERITSDLADMLDAARRDGVDLVICSAYRSFERQTTLFENKIRKFMKSGMSYMDAYALASYSVTVPGTSEHQLGLALDIITSSHMQLNESFENTKAAKWLKEHGPEFGFILRYPKGKEHITGIIYEPWHYRYVGKEHAKAITESGLCLEEYLK